MRWESARRKFTVLTTDKYLRWKNVNFFLNSSCGFLHANTTHEHTWFEQNELFHAREKGRVDHKTLSRSPFQFPLHLFSAENMEKIKIVQSHHKRAEV